MTLLPLINSGETGSLDGIAVLSFSVFVLLLFGALLTFLKSRDDREKERDREQAASDWKYCLLAATSVFIVGLPITAGLAIVWFSFSALFAFAKEKSEE